MEFITLNTYAKINLTLDVTGVREDGYHTVRMIMQSVDLHDEMNLRLIPSEETEIVLKCNKYYVPTDARNTAYKAAEKVIQQFPEAFHGKSVRIDIRKNIPVAAGLAGGSSNAAGVIVALNHLLHLGMQMKELCRIGAQIGADVPFCIMTLLAHPRWGIEGGSTCALAEGVGDILTPLKPLRMWCLLAKAAFSVSTAEVYKGLDQLPEYPHPDTDQFLKGMKEGNLPVMQKGMGNSLEAYTLKKYPEVERIKQLMMKYNEAMTMMSGSGPTVYSLFSGRKKAQSAFRSIQDALEKTHTEVYLVRTLV